MSKVLQQVGGVAGDGSFIVQDNSGSAEILVDGTKILGAQASVIAALTDSTGGTANDTVAQVADIALSTSDTYTDSAVNTAVNTAIATINDDLADLAGKVNEILTMLKAHGLLASS